MYIYTYIFVCVLCVLSFLLFFVTTFFSPARRCSRQEAYVTTQRTLSHQCHELNFFNFFPDRQCSRKRHIWLPQRTLSNQYHELNFFNFFHHFFLGRQTMLPRARAARMATLSRERHELEPKCHELDFFVLFPLPQQAMLPRTEHIANSIT